MRGKMDFFESQAKALVTKLQTYSLIEFHHDEAKLLN